ncbi:hypothetical protein E2320_014430, partial [Naja naja]
ERLLSSREGIARPNQDSRPFPTLPNLLGALLSNRQEGKAAAWTSAGLLVTSDREPGGTEKTTSAIHHQHKTEQLGWGASLVGEEDVTGCRAGKPSSRFLKISAAHLTGRGGSGMLGFSLGGHQVSGLL